MSWKSSGAIRTEIARQRPASASRAIMAWPAESDSTCKNAEIFHVFHVFPLLFLLFSFILLRLPLIFLDFHLYFLEILSRKGLLRASAANSWWPSKTRRPSAARRPCRELRSCTCHRTEVEIHWNPQKNIRWKAKKNIKCSFFFILFRIEFNEISSLLNLPPTCCTPVAAALLQPRTWLWRRAPPPRWAATPWLTRREF